MYLIYKNKIQQQEVLDFVKNYSGEIPITKTNPICLKLMEKK